MRILLILLIAFPCLGQRVLVPPSDTLWNGLVGWWTLNGNALDWSGKGNHGTIASPVFTNGTIGASILLNGSSQRVMTGVMPTYPITLSCWLFSTNSSGQCGLYGDAVNYENGFAIYLRHVDGAHFAFTFRGSSFLRAGSVVTNSWIHFVATCDSSLLAKIYTNGVFLAQAQFTDGSFTSTEASIGMAGNINSPQYFPGRIDDVRIYNRALSAEEIKLLYNGGYGR